MIKENITANEIIQVIVSNNTEDHNILKLAEECTELSEVLIKMVTKPNRREEKIDHLIEELGDVKLRLDVLLSMYGLNKKVNRRYADKLSYILESIDSKKYDNC